MKRSVFSSRPAATPVTLDTLEDKGFAVEPSSHPPRGKKAGLVLAFLGASSLLGSTALLPISALGTVGVYAAEPVAETWKRVPDSLPDVAIAQRNTIYDKNGKPIGQTWAEDRIELTNLNKISPSAIRGLIATEDKNFYRHEGFDPRGTARAALSGRGGGSGITQQLIKNLQFYDLLGTKEQKAKATAPTYGRKLHELKLAMAYESKHTKNEILLQYFNTVAFGAPTVYGIETASQYFFAKPAAKLTVAQAAALVGSAQNPVLYNMNDPKNTDWKDRQKEVLGRLVAEGDITQKQADAYAKEDLKFTRKAKRGGNCAQSKYPFYCEYTLDYLKNSPRLGETREEREAMLAKGGLQIHTYMDPAMMKTIDTYLKKNWGVKNRLIAPTAVVLPGSGGVAAFGANRDYGNGKGKTEIVLPNSPAGEGSAYKMFTLAAALNSGKTESDLAFSSKCPLRPGPKYDSPPGGFRNSNSCKMQGGFMNYKQATAYSSNTWYVTLEMRIGVEAVKQFSKSVGLAAPDSINSRSLSYALGSVGNSPIDVAAAYATFPNKGVFCPATPVKKLRYADGSEPAFPDTYDPAVDACRSVMSPKAAGTVLKALRSNVSGEVPKAFGIRSRVKGYDTGAKSGTNEGYNSAWAHVSSPYSLYTNVYDPVKTSRGIDGGVFRGRSIGRDNTAQTTGGELMAAVLKGTKNRPMDYNNPSDKRLPNQVDQTSFIAVPSVIGMTPEAALGVLRSVGITAHVSKETRPRPDGYPAGVISAQSIEPGKKLAQGTTKEIVIYIGS